MAEGLASSEGTLRRHDPKGMNGSESNSGREGGGCREAGGQDVNWTFD